MVSRLISMIFDELNWNNLINCESERMKLGFYYNRDTNDFEVDFQKFYKDLDLTNLNPEDVIIVNQHILIPTDFVLRFDLKPFCLIMRDCFMIPLYDKKKEIRECELKIKPNKLIFRLDDKDVEFHEIAWFRPKRWKIDEFLDINDLFLEDTCPGQIYLVSDKSPRDIEMSLYDGDTRIIGFFPPENMRKNISKIYLKLEQKCVEYDFKENTINAGDYVIVEKHIEPYCILEGEKMVEGITCIVKGEMYRPPKISNLIIRLYIDKEGLIRIKEFHYSDYYLWDFIMETDNSIECCLITFAKEDYSANPIMSRAQGRKEYTDAE